MSLNTAPKMFTSRTDLAYRRFNRAISVGFPPIATGLTHDFPGGTNTIQFSSPNKDNCAGNSYSVIDENNRNVANLGLSEESDDGTVTLNLGPEKQMRVSLVEQPSKLSKKQESINGINYERVSVEGKIVCYNVGQKFIRLDLYRDIFGEVIESGKGNISTPSGMKKTITWKLSLDKGQKKEMEYKYEALVPASSQ